MKYQFTIMSVLAATAVNAQGLGGDFGRPMMDGRMEGGSVLAHLLGGIFFLGLTILVWLWVVKLWREVRQKKKQ